MQCITAALVPIRNWRADCGGWTELFWGCSWQRQPMALRPRGPNGWSMTWWSQISCLEYDEYVTQWFGLQRPLFTVAWLCLDSDKCYHSLISIHSSIKALRLGAGMVKLSLRSFEKVEAIEDEAHALQIPCAPRVFLMNCFSMSVFHRLEEIENHHHQW